MLAHRKRKRAERVLETQDRGQGICSGTHAVEAASVRAGLRCRVSMLGLVQSSHPLRERARLQKSCAKQLISLSSASQTVSKYNAQYHKLFQSVPNEEILMKGKSLLQPLT